MAVKSVTRTDYALGVRFQWTLANGDTGEPVYLPEFGDRSWQVEGTFGSGGSVRPEGSNDGTNYRALTDPTQTAIAQTAAGLKQILESTLMVRPNCTAGDGTTAIVVTLFARRSVR